MFSIKYQQVFRKISAYFRDSTFLNLFFYMKPTRPNSYLERTAQQFFRRRTDQRLYRFSDSRTRTTRQQCGSEERSKPAFQLRTFYPELSGSPEAILIFHRLQPSHSRSFIAIHDGIRPSNRPNEGFYWKDKKICGTLIKQPDSIRISRSISGQRVNLNQERFISDAPNPVSLFL